MATSNGANALGIEAGVLKAGYLADITVLDPNRRITIEPRSFRSKSRNTPFADWELRGAPVMTLVGGEIVHDAR